MSTDYRPLSPIRITDLVDGRLKNVRVDECHNGEHGPLEKFLTDGKNYLSVYFNAEGLVTSFTRYAPTSDPQPMLSEIAETFDVEIVSEEQPRYWGLETEEQLAHRREVLRDLRRRRAMVQYPKNCELPVHEWVSIRKEAALHIDPETAEFTWCFTWDGDPYGISQFPEDTFGKKSFARSPGSDVWVCDGDLPDDFWSRHRSKIRADLWSRLRSKMRAKPSDEKHLNDEPPF